MRPTDFCHPNDLRAPVPRAFPIRCRGFHRVDTPRSLRLRAAYRGTGCFTTPKNASADRHADTRCLDSRFWRGCERGLLVPTAPDAIEPLTPLSPLPLSRNSLVRLRAPVSVRGSRRDHRPQRLVKGAGSCNPRCLPSSGTLRRIRWPLWPRSRDRLMLSRVATAGRRSHVILGLGRSCTVSLRRNPTLRCPFVRDRPRRFHARHRPD
jgi:hypothetical protein